MTADSDASIDELLDRADFLPEGSAEKVELYERAAALADAAKDIERGYELRVGVMDAALDAGLPERLTVAFTWCLAMSDRDPTAIDADDVLWRYRWAVSELPQFPEISRERIEAAIADMTARYRAAGSTLRAIHVLKSNVYNSMNDLAAAEAAVAAWKACPHDRWSDDKETEDSFEFTLFCNMNRYAEAVAMCPRILAGKRYDKHWFGSDSALLLEPLVGLGRIADAVRVQKKGYKLVTNNARYLDSIASHVEFLARLDDFAAAAKAFQSHVHFALSTKLLMDRLELFAAGWLLVNRLRRAGHERYRFKFPKDFPVPSTTAGIDLAAFADWLHADIAELAERFDNRNGNSFYANRLIEFAAKATADPLMP